MAQITNQAILSYNGNVVSSNIAVGEITEVLTVEKTAVGGTYTPGDNVTYIVSIVNSGTSPVNGVTVTDDLGAYAFGEETLYPLTYIDGAIELFVNGAAQSAPTVSSTSPLTVTGLSVPSGGNVVLVYGAKVSGYAPLGVGAVIENTVTADGAGITPVTATATISPAAEPELTITKSIDPPVVRESGTLTYAFLIQNYGGAEAVAGDNVKVTDTFDPILTSLNVSLDSESLARTTDYTYDETTGLFETVAGTITVPAATFSQDPDMGMWTTTPGETTLTVSGTL